MNRHLVFRLVMIAIALAAIVFAWRAFSRFSLAQIGQSLQAIATQRFVLAILFAALSYFLLTVIEMLALKHLGKPLAYRRIALTSFTSLSIGHNVGIAAFSSGAIRYRFYAQWGLRAEDVAKIVLFSATVIGLGQVTLAGLVLLIAPGGLAPGLQLSLASARILGSLCLLTVLAYLLLCWKKERPFCLWRFTIEVPSVPMALAQIVCGTANYLCVSACLYQLLQVGPTLGFLRISGAFVLANLLAFLVHVPGGLGVLEAALAYLLHTRDIGALIAFRIVYFLLPLPFGLVILFASSLFFRKGKEA
ncbi:UPF0104 family protein [Allorhizobium sp. BGMRC 0089]|uniref:UPF0104 family protein n=1 Tax=Allorhizobium sonneratiae TaxID=2934936 RepID=UPI0020335D08|nr:UPF0104 family protein [Allorhizobium sonneratiae]MCM2294062.1 UPF0104 family protein [Allorhizobium sonneratiae]